MSDPSAPSRPWLPPDQSTIAALAEAGLAGIPAGLRDHLAEVVIAVEELADDATLDELGIESAWDLTGLYRGLPRPMRSGGEVTRLPDTIILYRRAILLEWVETGEDLGRLVASVLIHEAAHHFGFSDAEIEAIERAI